MSTSVLLHGAGSDSWHWHLVEPALFELGHDVVAVDLPCDDDSAGLEEYVDAVLDVVGRRRDLIVVAPSLAGFVGPLVCDRAAVSLLVLVNSMVPRSGETAAQWWTNAGHVFPEPFDPVETFLHDVPAEVVAESARHLRRQSDAVVAQPWPRSAWPDVATRYLLCRDDRFFPADFQRRMVADRLDVVPQEMEGGHLPALARPLELVARLEALRSSLEGARAPAAQTGAG